MEEQLPETERYVGCYADLEGQIGLSFKGLGHPIEIKVGDHICKCQPGTFQPLQVSAPVAACLRGLIGIWEVQQSLIWMESDPAVSDDEIEQYRFGLNCLYDDFVSCFGNIADSLHLIMFDGIPDPRLTILRELEVGPNLEKAKIFYQRILNPSLPTEGQLFFDEDLSDRLGKSLVKCLDEKGGQIDIDRIAELAGTDPDTAENILVEAGRLFREPIVVGGNFARTAPKRLG